MGDTFPVVGVVGAGTMGLGIAEVVARSGRRVLLHDRPEPLARAESRLAEGLERQVARGRLSEDEARAVRARIEAVDALEPLASLPAEALIIEAVTEDEGVKAEVFRGLGAFLGVVATNTSSLPIARLARHAPRAERFLGLHFFNPVPAMRLVEVIPGPFTRPEDVRAAAAFARDLGKTPVEAPDLPGFLVNRLARPFYLEPLRLLEAGIAPGPAALDRLAEAAGYPMGPFRLMDLIGLDVNLVVTRTVYEATFADPRYRPSVLQSRRVEAGLLGRKAGVGFYRYDGGEEGAAPPAAPPPWEGRLFVAGAGPLARALRARAEARGVPLVGDPRQAAVRILADALPTGEREGALQHLGDGRAVLIATAFMGSAASFRAAGARRAFAFSCLPSGDAADLSAAPGASDDDRRTAVGALGRLFGTVVTLADAPGLYLARLASALVAEAYSLWAATGLAPETLDEAVVLGLNHPRGPFALAREVGPGAVVSCLRALGEELRLDHYPIPPSLLRAAGEEA